MNDVPANDKTGLMGQRRGESSNPACGGAAGLREETIMKLSEIFEDRPRQWGFRGDPYFWDHLKERAQTMDLVSPEELEAWIRAEYLSLAGTDNNLHYQTKIDCVNLILDNIDNTFITPVFNGSASLRSAAGQMVETTVKNVRRGKEADDAFIEDMYSDVTQMYRLGEQNIDRASKDLGPLPLTARILLGSIGAAWLGMGIYVVKKRQMSYNSRRSEARKTDK